MSSQQPSELLTVPELAEALALHPLTKDHPLWRLVGSATSDGRKPDSSDKYGVLADE